MEDTGVEEQKQKKLTLTSALNHYQACPSQQLIRHQVECGVQGPSFALHCINKYGVKENRLTLSLSHNSYLEEDASNVGFGGLNQNMVPSERKLSISNS